MAPTIYEVARRARVSTATVSRALNGSGPVAEATRRRIEAAIEEVGYELNRVARSLVTSTTQTIAILVPDITNPFFPDLVKGAQLLAEERRYTLLLLNTSGDAAKEAVSFRTLRGKQVDGVILVGVAASGQAVRRALGASCPIVQLDRVNRTPPEDAMTVQLDHLRGSQHAVQHLLGLGHRSIAHMTGPRGLHLARQRAAGYRQTLRAAAVSTSPELIASGDFTEEGGYRAVERVLDRGHNFTALFAANDLMAIGAMAALKAHGLRVPDDISVVGFDDIHLCLYTTPPLTTVRQPAYEMGRRAAEMLIDRLESRNGSGPETVTFQPTLVVRGSTGPVPARPDGGGTPGAGPGRLKSKEGR